MTSRHHLALAAGLFYLLVIITGGWSELEVRAPLLVEGDLDATAMNIIDASGTLKLAFASDAIMMASFLLIGLVLHELFRAVSRPAATAMLVFNAVSVAVMAVNLLNHAALVLLADGTLAGSLEDGSDFGLMTFFLELHSIGYLVAQVFFGLYLLPLGYLVYRSGWIPRALGALLMLGSAADMAQIGVEFFFPGASDAIVDIVAAPAGLAEFSLAIWLIGFALKTVAVTGRAPESVPA